MQMAEEVGTATLGNSSLPLLYQTLIAMSRQKFRNKMFKNKKKSLWFCIHIC